MEQKTMKALRSQGIPKQMEIKDIPVPEIIEPTDAIVRVTLATICGSDLHMYFGEMGQVPEMTVGHEYCGEVVEVGSAVEGFKPGDKVIVRPAYSCGHCYTCMFGMGAICQTAGCIGVPNGPDGCFAEYTRVQFANTSMQHLPANLTEDEAVMVNDVLATAYFGVHNGGVKAGDRVIVYGAGPIGLMAAMLSKKAGAKQVIVVNRSKARLDKAIEKGVADAVICAAEQDPVQTSMLMTEYCGADVVIETIGTEESMNNAIQMVRMKGTVSSVSVIGHPITLNWGLVLGKNLTIKSGMQNFDGCAEMLQDMVDGKLDVKWLGTHKAPLNDIIHGYEVFSEKQDGCIKWLITPYDHSRGEDYTFKVEEHRTNY